MRPRGPSAPCRCRQDIKRMSCFWLQEVQTRRSHLKCVEGGGQVHCKHLHHSSQPLGDPRADRPGLLLRALEVCQGPEQQWQQGCLLRGGALPLCPSLARSLLSTYWVPDLAWAPGGQHAHNSFFGVRSLSLTAQLSKCVPYLQVTEAQCKVT